MRAAGLSGLVARKRGRTTIHASGVRVADDLVERRFRPEAPDVLWVADTTYRRTWEGWVYLAAVQGAYSRRIVDWSMAEHVRAELVVDAREMAPHHRRPAPNLVHHSDRATTRITSSSATGSRSSAGHGIPRRPAKPRPALAAGHLARLVREDHVTGGTSNQSDSVLRGRIAVANAKLVYADVLAPIVRSERIHAIARRRDPSRTAHYAAVGLRPRSR